LRRPYDPVDTLDGEGVWTHDIPKGDKDEQLSASGGFRVDANSDLKIQVIEEGVWLTEITEEWTKIHGHNGPGRSGWLREREHTLFIRNDGLTQYGEFMTEPVNQPGHDQLGYDERTDEKAIGETGGLSVPLQSREAEFAEKVMTAFEAQYSQQAAA